tara:strand:+ start:161 stop:640 length:480 start_codon:yes stop_codon:yes gene_type:complete
MKTYKDLKETLSQITETQEVAGGAARSAHSDFGVHRIESQIQLARLNSFLNAYTQREFLDPKNAISEIRQKLNLAGLDFDWNNSSTISVDETKNLTLKRWGGSFGTTPTHNLMKQGFYTSDNISEFNNGIGLSLKVNLYRDDDGLYDLDAKIVPNTNED